MSACKICFLVISVHFKAQVLPLDHLLRGTPNGVVLSHVVHYPFCTCQKWYCHCFFFFFYYVFNGKLKTDGKDDHLWLVSHTQRGDGSILTTLAHLANSRSVQTSKAADSSTKTNTRIKRVVVVLGRPPVYVTATKPFFWLFYSSCCYRFKPLRAFRLVEMFSWYFAHKNKQMLSIDQTFPYTLSKHILWISIYLLNSIAHLYYYTVCYRLAFKSGFRKIVSCHKIALLLTPGPGLHTAQRCGLIKMCYHG